MFHLRLAAWSPVAAELRFADLSILWKDWKRTIEQFSSATKISRSRLLVIENNEFGRVPGGLFTPRAPEPLAGGNRAPR